jgi:hypothetical protein
MPFPASLTNVKGHVRTNTKIDNLRTQAEASEVRREEERREGYIYRRSHVYSASEHRVTGQPDVPRFPTTLVFSLFILYKKLKNKKTLKFYFLINS